jgi:muconolactone delta-isomerase
MLMVLGLGQKAILNLSVLMLLMVPWRCALKMVVAIEAAADGTRKEYADGAVKQYDAKGQLTNLWGANGDYAAFSYNDKGERTEMRLRQPNPDGSYPMQPKVFGANPPSGALQDSGKTYKSVEVDPKTGDITYTKQNGGIELQHADGRKDTTTPAQPNPVFTSTDKDGHVIKSVDANGVASSFEYKDGVLTKASLASGQWERQADGTYKNGDQTISSLRALSDGSISYKDSKGLDTVIDGSRHAHQ